jgi:hypothetical protein
LYIREVPEKIEEEIDEEKIKSNENIEVDSKFED